MHWSNFVMEWFRLMTFCPCWEICPTLKYGLFKFRNRHLTGGRMSSILTILEKKMTFTSTIPKLFVTILLSLNFIFSNQEAECHWPGPFWTQWHLNGPFWTECHLNVPFWSSWPSSFLAHSEFWGKKLSVFGTKKSWEISGKMCLNFFFFRVNSTEIY